MISIGDRINAEDTAEALESLIETDEIIGDVESEGSSFIAEGDDSKVMMPADSNGNVDISLEDGETISSSLPLEIETSKGIATEGGTVVYKGTENVDISVQALETEQNGLCLSGMRTAVTIGDKDAPKEYSFEYDLPEGCKLITSEEFDGNDTADAGCIYIVNTMSDLLDEEGTPVQDILAVIEPAWAKDANQEDVDTYYKVLGNTLIQVVEFDDDTAFPVIADPKTSTKPKSKKLSSDTKKCNISHTYIQAGSFIAGGTWVRLSSAARAKVTRAIVAKLGSKFIPILGWASFALLGYTYLQSARGYSHTHVTVYYETWSCYKRQASRWVRGTCYKNVKATLKLVK